MPNTTNYGLTKPQIGSLHWDQEVNNNLVKINKTENTTRVLQRETQKTIDSVNDFPPKPLGFNMGFDFWQRGASFSGFAIGATYGGTFCADKWIAFPFEGPNSTITRVASLSTDPFKYKLRMSGDTGSSIQIRNYIPFGSLNSSPSPLSGDFYKFFRGKTVTFSINGQKFGSAADIGLHIRIHDGIGSSTASFANNNTPARKTATHSVSSLATDLRVQIEFSTSVDDTFVDIWNASLSIGNYSELSFIPIHPQDDYYGCASVYQIIQIDSGWYDQDADVTLRKTIPFPCPMLLIPTATRLITGTSSKGSATLNFVPTSSTEGYIEVLGLTKTTRLADITGAVFALEVK
jgi:hypothetical protein